MIPHTNDTANIMKEVDKSKMQNTCFSLTTSFSGNTNVLKKNSLHSKDARAYHIENDKENYHPNIPNIKKKYLQKPKLAELPDHNNNELRNYSENSKNLTIDKNRIFTEKIFVENTDKITEIIDEKFEEDYLLSNQDKNELLSEIDFLEHEQNQNYEKNCDLQNDYLQNNLENE